MEDDPVAAAAAERAALRAELASRALADIGAHLAATASAAAVTAARDSTVAWAGSTAAAGSDDGTSGASTCSAREARSQF